MLFALEGDWELSLRSLAAEARSEGTFNQQAPHKQVSIFPVENAELVDAELLIMRAHDGVFQQAVNIPLVLSRYLQYVLEAALVQLRDIHF